MSDVRKSARELAHEHIARGDHTGWFEALYARANEDPARIPWADLTPNPHLVSWVERAKLRGEGKRALVVGCGLGDDALYLADLGFSVLAFDLSPTAIAWCRKSRGEHASIRWVVADLLALPQESQGAYDFVFEAYTIQSLGTEELRARAIEATAATVAPGGTLLVIARGRDSGAQVDGPPWPLTREELHRFEGNGLSEKTFEDYLDDETPPQRRFRIVYGR